MYRALFVLCAVFSLCYVQLLVCVMYSFSLCYGQILFALCAVFSMCYVQFAVTTLVAPLRACLASLGMAYASMYVFGLGKNERWCADSLFRTFVDPRNEIPPYIYIYIHLIIYKHTSPIWASD